MKYTSQDDCDPSKPEEHFLWALGVVPVGDKVNQPIQPNLARNISKHLFECGFRHYPKLQKKKLNRPFRGEQHLLNGSGRWVPIDAEETAEPPEPPDVAAMTPKEREALVQELKDYGAIQDPPPDRGKTAKVTSWRELQSKHIRKASELNDNSGPDSPA